MRLVEALAEGLPVLYNSVVTDIAYSDAGVCVQTASHQLAGALSHLALRKTDADLFAATSFVLQCPCTPLQVRRVCLYDCSEQGTGLIFARERFLDPGDAVVVTIPLGCLKAGDLRFQPPLPDAKLAAIRNLGYGLLNKVLLFDTCHVLLWANL